MKIITALLFVFNFSLMNAQLLTESIGPIESIVQYGLERNGAVVSNVKYTGSLASIGKFNGENTTLDIKYGILLTTGIIEDEVHGPHGPNNLTHAGLDVGTSGYAPLSQMISTTTKDAAVLEFEVVPLHDTFKIEYIFGSEEYPEYVGTQFSDAFAIFISGPGIPDGTQNIALVPNTTLPININNINNMYNLTHYISNGDGSQSPYNEDEEYIQYDGFTKLLTAYSLVTPGETYHIAIAIADVGDALYDSGVFIKTNYSTMGVDESDLKKQLNLYPNPCKGVFTIDKPFKGKIKSLKIIDSTGKEVSFTVEESDDLQLNIKLRKTSLGIFWVVYTCEDGTFYSSKLIVE